jgi:hypothetical protein
MLAILLLMPAMPRERARPSRINCVNNLKQVGLAFKQFAADHNDQFPMQVCATNGGSMEFAGNAFQHFIVLSNELSTPKILYCPADKKRAPAATFSNHLSNANISYFVGIDCIRTNPQMLLSGDRNLTNGIRVRNGLLSLTTNEPAGWTQDLHEKQGNGGLADGSVQQLTSSRLRDQIANSGAETNRLAMP